MKECMKNFAESGIYKSKPSGPIGTLKNYYLHTCKIRNFSVEIPESLERSGAAPEILVKYCNQCKKQ